MLPVTDRIDFATIEIPQVRRSPWGYLKIGAALLAIGGATWAWRAGFRPPLLAQESKSKVEFVEIDRGDVDLSVVETGSIESANNTTVRCQVEALLGLVGGSQGTASGKGAGGGMGQGAGGLGGQGGSAAGGAGGGQAAAAPTKSTKSKSKTTKKAGSSSTATAGSSTAGGTSSSGGTSPSGSSSGSSSTGSTATSGSSAGATGTTTAGSKPVIRSFTYAVALHVPLRPVTAKAADTSTQKKTQPQGGGFGGGGGRRGGRGGGGMGGQDEKPGSTNIVDIIPDGSKVKAGDLVCRLDSSAFEDEEKAQLIRYLQAKSFVEQANAILEVNLITLREYRDGIYPQDLQLVRQYVQTCQLECDRLERNTAWSIDMQKKGYRTRNQVKGDVLALEQAKIALGEATNMIERLTKQTGPKLLKSLEANVRAIESDKLLQDASFNLEDQRLKRIRKNIKNCTLLAPRDGIVVYANETNRWGQVTAQIDQGVTVRQDQPIFNLPDPKHMRVKARINESKFAMVHTDQVVKIVVDAYPERPLQGRVAEVAAINTPLNASDVKIYYANVDIIDEFDDLRPGLSAQVIFKIDARKAVIRVPLESIRWVGAQTYVALYDRLLAEAGKKPWSWRNIELGLSDSRYAEVVSGVQAGDRVVASPLDLPEPVKVKARQPATSVAGLGL